MQWNSHSIHLCLPLCRYGGWRGWQRAGRVVGGGERLLEVPDAVLQRRDLLRLHLQLLHLVQARDEQVPRRLQFQDETLPAGKRRFH